jgi:hypothetical protein
MTEIVQTIPLSGFDPEGGEPEMRVMDDGTLYVVFNLMPPLWAEDNPDDFSDFDKQMESAVGVPIIWEDREFFRIDHPKSDTIERVRRFLDGYQQV